MFAVIQLKIEKQRELNLSTEQISQEESNIRNLKEYVKNKGLF